jgi:hypothetical protein
MVHEFHGPQIGFIDFRGELSHGLGLFAEYGSGLGELPLSLGLGI